MHTLAAANPWWDEGFTYWLSSMDVPAMLLRTAGDTHPPLSYLLYHLWMLPAGRSIYALRFMSALFGIAAIPVCAATARRLAGPLAGTLAGFILAVSRFHIWWSQQIRMYALVGLLCALSIYLLLRVLSDWKWRRTGAVGLLLALGVVNLAGLFTLYFFAVLVLLESLLVLARVLGRRDWPLAAAWAALQFGSLVLFLPWLAYFRQHAIRFPAPPAPPLDWMQFVAATWSELTLGIDTNVDGYRALLLALGGIALLLVASLLLGPGRVGRRLFGRGSPAEGPDGQRGLALWLAFAAVGLPLAAYAVTLQKGLFFSAAYQTRYDLPALPALVVLLAWGIARLPRAARLAPLALFAGVAVYTLPGLYHDRHRTDDYQSLARFVQAYERPGDAILFDPDWNFHLFLLDYRGALPWESIPLNQPVDAVYANQLLSPWAARYSGLWLLQEAGGHDAGATHPVRDWLGAHLRPTLRLAVGDKLLILYEPSGAAPRSLNAAFRPEHEAAGVSFDQPLTDVRPGDVLTLSVYAAPAAISSPPSANVGAVNAGRSSGQARLPASQPLAATAGGSPDRADLPAKVELAGQVFAGRQLPGQAVFAIPIGSEVAAGRQTIQAVLANGRSVPFSSVYVEPHPPAAAPAAEPPLANNVGRGFGGQAQITSYATSQAGQQITVRLQWRALRAFAQNYTVFVHLLDSAGHVAAQRDSQPLDGQLPTVRWQPGQIVDDHYTMPAPKPGSYQIEIGLYLQSTGERLPLSEDPTKDHLLLGPISVR